MGIGDTPAQVVSLPRPSLTTTNPLHPLVTDPLPPLMDPISWKKEAGDRRLTSHALVDEITQLRSETSKSDISLMPTASTKGPLAEPNVVVVPDTKNGDFYFRPPEGECCVGVAKEVGPCACAYASVSGLSCSGPVWAGLPAAFRVPPDDDGVLQGTVRPFIW